MTTAPTTAEAPAETLAAPATRVCPNCAGEFARPTKGPGGHKRFCGEKCRTSFQARAAAEGKVVITHLKAWRKMRGTGLGKDFLSELTTIVDGFNARDIAEGRPPLTDKGPIADFLRDVLSDRYVDRQRPR